MFELGVNHCFAASKAVPTVIRVNRSPVGNGGSPALAQRSLAASLAPHREVNRPKATSALQEHCVPDGPMRGTDAADATSFGRSWALPSHAASDTRFVDLLLLSRDSTRVGRRGQRTPALLPSEDLVARRQLVPLSPRRCSQSDRRWLIPLGSGGRRLLWTPLSHIARTQILPGTVTCGLSSPLALDEQYDAYIVAIT